MVVKRPFIVKEVVGGSFGQERRKYCEVTADVYESSCLIDAMGPMQGVRSDSLK